MHGIPDHRHFGELKRFNCSNYCSIFDIFLLTDRERQYVVTQVIYNILV